MSSPTQQILITLRNILQDNLPQRLENYGVPSVREIRIGHPPIDGGAFAKSPLISIEPAEGITLTVTMGTTGVGKRMREVAIDIWVWLLAKDDEQMSMLTAGYVDAIDEVLSSHPTLQGNILIGETRELSYSPRIETEAGLAQIVAVRFIAKVVFVR